MRPILLGLVLLTLGTVPMLRAGKPIVIAHRGASGYLPEHSLAAKALAYGQGADYLEQDLVLSKDGIPVVLHDIHLDTVTDVVDVFPGRKRVDGRYYALDFTVAELKQLRLNERINLSTGKRVFPERYPAGRTIFQIPTFAEEIEMIQGLNRSTNQNIGIYPEIKQPAWHRKQGQDISLIVLNLLQEYGYTTQDDAIYLQCFDFQETRRIREKLNAQVKLIQLFGDEDWAHPATKEGRKELQKRLQKIAEYADGIGPAMSSIVTGTDDNDQLVISDLVNLAHQAGLQVHPWTFRKDDLPGYASSMEQVMQIFCGQAEIDGFFTDFPDLGVQFLSKDE